MARQLVLRVLAAAAAVLLLVIVISLVLAHKARVDARRYLDVVTDLHMGSSYESVVQQMRAARILPVLPDDCHSECTVAFRRNDRLLYTLHLAPPADFVGRLDFRDNKLIYKSTAMGKDVCCIAAVLESSSTASEVSLSEPAFPTKITVSVSASDFTEYRRKAYAFNLSCIGSIRGCRTDEYLPTVRYLQRETVPQ